MTQFIPHDKLDVYHRAIAFAQLAMETLNTLPPAIAVRGQLDRAMESIITNLVLSVRHQRSDKGIYHVECSLGSVLECAACFDVAQHRQLIDAAHALEAKKLLQEIARMEIGLRKSWADASQVREGEAGYDTGETFYFNHEKMDVCQRTFELHKEILPVFGKERLTSRYAKRIDELSTGLTLNIAEGNGRYSRRDHGEFLGIAENAGAKLSAYLDLAAMAWSMDMNAAKSLLREIVAMLGGLKKHLQGGAA